MEDINITQLITKAIATMPDKDTKPFDEISSRFAKVSRRCPHLGLHDDPATALSFPSKLNYCHNVKKINTPSMEQQRKICLTPRRITCPVLDSEKQKSLPKDLCMPDPEAKRKLIKRWVIVAISLSVIILMGLIFSGYWKLSWIEKFSSPMWSSETAPQQTMPNTPTMLIETETPTVAMETNTAIPEKNIITETPQPSRESIAATQTKSVLENSCAYQLETPFGHANRQLLLHKIADGESIALLAERYAVTFGDIDAVNYYLPTLLPIEFVIIIPINIENGDDLPAFKPVLLDEDDISLEELAQTLLVTSSDLIEFNQLDSSCRSFHGWILIPAEKITPRMLSKGQPLPLTSTLPTGGKVIPPG